MAVKDDAEDDNTIAQDIAAAIDGMDAEDEIKVDPAIDEPVVEPTDEPVDEPVDETTDDEPVDELEIVAVDEDDDLEVIEAPEHWAEEDKKAFSELDAIGQDFLLRRYQGMEADYTKKTMELADQRKGVEALEAINGVLEPHRAQFAASGLNDAQGLAEVMNIYASLQSDPVGTIAWLSQQLGVDQDYEQEPADPALQALTGQVNKLQSQLTEGHQAQQARVQQSVSAELSAFAAETDDTGVLKYPHYETLRDSMSQMVNSGMANTLPEAYSKSLLLQPELTAADALADKASAAAAKAKRAKAATHKQAAKGIESGTKGKEASTDLSLHDTIEGLYDRLASG